MILAGFLSESLSLVFYALLLAIATHHWYASFITMLIFFSPQYWWYFRYVIVIAFVTFLSLIFAAAAMIQYWYWLYCHTPILLMLFTTQYYYWRHWYWLSLSFICHYYITLPLRCWLFFAMLVLIFFFTLIITLIFQISQYWLCFRWYCHYDDTPFRHIRILHYAWYYIRWPLLSLLLTYFRYCCYWLRHYFSPLYIITFVIFMPHSWYTLIFLSHITSSLVLRSIFSHISFAIHWYAISCHITLLPIITFSLFRLIRH